MSDVIKLHVPFLSGFVHLFTSLMESFTNCLPGSTNCMIWSITVVWLKKKQQQDQKITAIIKHLNIKHIKH